MYKARIDIYARVRCDRVDDGKLSSFFLRREKKTNPFFGLSESSSSTIKPSKSYAMASFFYNENYISGIS